MGKDDYFVLVNKFLRYLYKCLKQNMAPDWDLLAPNTKAFPIHEEYFAYLLSHLIEDGYIEGIAGIRRIGQPVQFRETSGIKITPAGIEYLEENSTMKRVTEFLGPAGDIASTVIQKFW